MTNEFSSEQAAKILRISLSEANRMFDEGRIKGGRRDPQNSRSRLFPRPGLIEFARTNPGGEIPTYGLCSERVVAFVQLGDLADRCAAELKEAELVSHVVEDAHGLARLLGETLPALVVVNPAGGTEMVRRVIRHFYPIEKPVLVALVPPGTASCTGIEHLIDNTAAGALIVSTMLRLLKGEPEKPKSEPRLRALTAS